MLIVVYLAGEFSFNTFHEHYRDIYRVNFNKRGDADQRAMANAPIPAGPAIAQDVRGVEAVARLYNRGGIMEAGTRRFQETKVEFVDKGILDVFTVHFTEGNPKTALDLPNGVVLTTDMARKYFGEGPALGKVLRFEHRFPLQVTGVVEPWPPTSDEQFDFLIPFDAIYAVESPKVGDFLRTNWIYNATDTYVLLQPGRRGQDVTAAVRGLTKRYGDERAAKSYYLSLQPLSDIHLYAAQMVGNPSTNSIAYIYIFAAIAFLILLIANINFINLSNAQALNRIGEIGVRKVSGADRFQLIVQFLGEGMLISFIALILALGLTLLALPFVGDLTGTPLRAGTLVQGPVMAAFVGLFVCTGLLAGLYPALFVTGFSLTALLKNKSRVGGRVIRQGLIVTQFTIAVALIIGAVVIHRQLQFLRARPLGFEKDQLLVIPLFGKASSPVSNTVDSALRGRMNAFENDLRAYGAISDVTLASVLPGTPYVLGLVIPEGHKEEENIFLPWASVDYDYVRTMGLRIVAGRDFSKAMGTDNRAAFLLNESAVRQFGWTPKEAVGKTMVRGDSHTGKRGFVIGVVKDFNFAKLDQPVQAMIMDVNVPRFTTFAVRIGATGVPSTLRYIHETWDKHFPDLVFEYSFLDEDINALYKAQESLSKLVGYFAALAIFISAIGIFSLASFIAVRRTKEIGIRRVLGANTGSIVALLLKDFQRGVLLALLLASPLAWYLMNRWLRDFAYRTSISWWIFAIAAVGTLAVTVLTVGFQGLRASRAKPVESLRVD